jgi:hypothetical protein
LYVARGEGRSVGVLGNPGDGDDDNGLDGRR